MHVAVYSTRPDDRKAIEQANGEGRRRAGAHAQPQDLTSRGAVVGARAAIDALKTGALGSPGLDVYEDEGDLVFRDLSAEVIHDDVFARLLTLPNVVVTGHQAFFTEDALNAIAAITLANLDAVAATGKAAHPVSVERIV